MRNVSTGFGLCIVGLGIAAWPVLDRLMPQANAVSVGLVAPAVAAAALAQDPPAPTIVWYGLSSPSLGAGGYFTGALFRAWSDGKVEAKWFLPNGPSGCSFAGTECDWQVISTAAQGLTFDADLNFDHAVDGNDLGMLLAKWGPAPRNPVPPSDCPLALINP